MAVLVGKEQYNCTFKVTTLIVYKLEGRPDSPHGIKTVKLYERNLPEILNEVSTKFEFINKTEGQPDSIYLADKSMILIYNYVNNKLSK